MQIFIESLLVLALIGFIAVIIWTAMSAIKLKNSVVANAKQLYLPPVNAVKNLAATGKGLVFQEGVHVKHIGSTIKGTSHHVSEIAREIKVTVSSIPVAETKTMLRNGQNILHLLNMASKLVKQASD